MTIDLQSVDPAFAAQIFVNGGGGNDTLEGPNQASQFVVTGNLSGTLNAPAPVTFTGIQNLQGGTAADRFIIQNGATFGAVSGQGGTITGGGGGDSVLINLSSAIGPITANDTGNGNTLTVVSNTVGDNLEYDPDDGCVDLVSQLNGHVLGFPDAHHERPLGSFRLHRLDPGRGDPDLAGDLPGRGSSTGSSTSPRSRWISQKHRARARSAISASSASLFPGTTHSATIGSITGTYVSSTKTFSLTLNNVNLNAGGLLTATFSSLSITDNENGAANQTLVSVQDATVTLPPLDDTTLTIQGTPNVPGLTITKQGFTLASLTANLPSVTFQNALELMSPAFQFSNVAYSTTGDSLSGTVTISAATVASLPEPVRPVDLLIDGDRIQRHVQSGHRRGLARRLERNPWLRRRCPA